MVPGSPTCLPGFFHEYLPFFTKGMCWNVPCYLATSIFTCSKSLVHGPRFSYLPTWVFSRIPPIFYEGYVLERSLLPRYLYFHMFQIIGAWSQVLLPAYLGFFTNTSHFLRRVCAGTFLATSLPLFSHVPNHWCMVPGSPTCLPGFFHEYLPFFTKGMCWNVPCYLATSIFTCSKSLVHGPRFSYLPTWVFSRIPPI